MSLMHTLTPETLLPDLFLQYPQTRSVFNQYGLRGCGGEHGPSETIDFFAAAHGVDRTQLINQLAQVINNPTVRELAEKQLKTDVKSRWIDAIYRPFFLSAIVVMLTAGAAWGVLLLFKISQLASYTGVSALEINAHGHAQIMGWVGLFIIGFAYQALPRMWHVEIPRPALSAFVLIGLLLGVALRVTAMYEHLQAWAMPAHLIGVAIEASAVLIFAGQIVIAYSRSKEALQPYVGFIFAAIGFLVLQVLYGGWHMDQLLRAQNRSELLAQLSRWQSPLRDMQIHGLAMLMIFGVGMRMFPAFLGLPAITHRRAWLVLGMIVSAVVLEIVFFVAMSTTGSHAWGAMLMLPWLMLLAGTGMLIQAWKLWRPTPVVDRSSKFIRSAFGWLVVSLLMLLFLPVYSWLSGHMFSHAYYGSARHAITVGFISLMIVGVSCKVVPTLRGVGPAYLKAMWLSFVLINLGCAMRVIFQVGTDWHPVFFSLVGLSGILEWAGFAFWGWHIFRVMFGRSAANMDGGNHQAEMQQESVPEQIVASHRVAQVLAWYPELEPLFVASGFGLIAKPMLRRTLATQVTLEQACALKGVPCEAFVLELNNAQAEHESYQRTVSGIM